MPAYDAYVSMAGNVKMEGSTLYKEGVKGSAGTAGEMFTVPVTGRIRRRQRLRQEGRCAERG